MSQAQVLVVFLAFTLMVIFCYSYMSEYERKRLVHEADGILTATQSSILADLKESETMFTELTQTLRFMILTGYNSETIHQYMKDIINDIILEGDLLSGYEGIYGFFDAYGGQYLDSLDRQLPEGYVAQERPWYRTALEGKGKVSATAPYIGYSSDDFVVTYTRQILDDNGRQLAIVCLDKNITTITDFVTSISLAKNGFGVMLDQNLIHIAHPSKDFLNRSIYESNASIVSMAPLLKKGEEISEYKITNYQGKISIVFYRPLVNGWYLGVVIQRDQYYKNTRDMALYLILFALFLAIVLSITLVRMVTAKNKVEERMSVMFEATPLSCVMIDKNLNIMECNKETLKLFGLSTKKEFYEHFFDLSPEYQNNGRLSRNLISECVLNVFKLGYDRFEWDHIDIHGNPIPAEITLVRIKYLNDYAIASYVRDLRETKAMEQERRKAELAEESNKTKSDFLARVSHEIRTPLNAILGIAEIQLQGGNLSDNDQEAFGRIASSGGLLLGIINDILDLSKIEAGKMELMQAKYEVASLIHDTAHLNLIRYESKPINFSLKIGEKIPSVLIGDELRIKQILNNLLSNAFKYTEKGDVTLTVSAEYPDEESDIVTLVFRVSDTGQGMTAEQIEKLGNSYSRFNMEANRRTVGTGLGMTITKTLVNLMDGKIIVESTPGAGSVFTVKLPQWSPGIDGIISKELADNLCKFRISSLSSLSKSDIKREFMPYGRILIVDDVETNLYVARGLMAPYGLSIDCVSSGFAAIDRIKEGSTYDIIFMDHMMPKLDGMETTKIIRDMGYNRPVVALTANALVGQAEIFMKCGFDDFISKPIDIRDLNATLNRLVRDVQSPEIIQEAREQEKRLVKMQEFRQPVMDSKLAEVFLRDAKKNLRIIEVIYQNKIKTDDDISLYIINVHAMKSALANINEQEASSAARKLEEEGRARNINFLLSETPVFLTSLKEIIQKLETQIAETDSTVDQDTEDSMFVLREKLAVIQTAAKDFNKKTIKNALGELNQQSWSPSSKEFLEKLGENLLHSEFEEIEKITSEFLYSK
jgi:signal transduction histidine kinase/DNA-binding response OmpR family regulator